MLAPWKESYEKPSQHIKKQSHHFANKGSYSQSYGFPVVMYGCESWTVKNADHWRIDAFELWCWKRLLRVPWTSGRSNQSILNEINSERSLEGLMFRLKLQYFGHLMWRADSLEKTLMLEKIEGKRGKEAVANKMVRQHHWLNRHGFEQTLGDNKGQGSLACCCPWVTESWTWLSDWTTTSVNYLEGVISLGLSLFILRVSMLALTHLPTAHKEPCWSYRLLEARATSVLVSIT